MATQQGIIPPDNELRAMTAFQVKRLADSLAPPDREKLATALLGINGCLGKSTGAYSERRGTDRNRRICGREIKFATLGSADWIIAPVPESAISRLVNRAANASLTDQQIDVWVLSELGESQTRIAELLGIGQSYVSKMLDQARQAIWDYVDNNSIEMQVFRMESHRAAYFPPHAAPMLPPWLDPVRQRFENEPGIITSVNQDEPSILKIWHEQQFTRMKYGGVNELPERYPISRFKPRIKRERKINQLFSAN